MRDFARGITGGILKMADKTNKYNSIIETQSAKFGFDPLLIKAVIMTESSFNEKAYRYEPGFYKRYIKDNKAFKNNPFVNEPRIISASYGLMQLMYTTASELGLNPGDGSLLYDPEINIMLGCKLLQKKRLLYGLPLGILSYNSGSPKGKKPEEEPNFNYLQKIAKYYVNFGGKNLTITDYV